MVVAHTALHDSAYRGDDVRWHPSLSPPPREAAGAAWKETHTLVSSSQLAAIRAMPPKIVVPSSPSHPVTTAEPPNMKLRP